MMTTMRKEMRTRKKEKMRMRRNGLVNQKMLRRQMSENGDCQTDVSPKTRAPDFRSALRETRVQSGPIVFDGNDSIPAPATISIEIPFHSDIPLGNPLRGVLVRNGMRSVLKPTSSLDTYPLAGCPSIHLRVAPSSPPSKKKAERAPSSGGRSVTGR